VKFDRTRLAGELLIADRQRNMSVARSSLDRDQRQLANADRARIAGFATRGDRDGRFA
jgi:hypothetical protein